MHDLVGIAAHAPAVNRRRHEARGHASRGPAHCPGCIANALQLRSDRDEAARSSARVVNASDSERRQLERNLHDGAQQRLVSLAIQLARLSNGLVPDSDEARLLAGAQEQLAASLQELRELAAGLHPAVLDSGLGCALQSIAARAPLPVAVTVDIQARPDAAVEVAAYYLVCETLTNVAKYAGATTAAVTVTRENDRLVVNVVDDGIGGADPSRGSGLRGLADRVNALGGSVRVSSPPGLGTTVRAEIPCPAR